MAILPHTLLDDVMALRDEFLFDVIKKEGLGTTRVTTTRRTPTHRSHPRVTLLTSDNTLML
jgi:hypothetical protein